MGTGVAHLLRTAPQVEVDTHSVTRLLQAWNAGSDAPVEALVPLVYGELRSIAGHLMRGEAGTLQPTALVHEAYLRLLDQRQLDWQDRAHFYAISVRIMRRVIIDYARARSSWKRGGRNEKVPVAEALDAFEERCEQYVTLDDALRDLERKEPQRGAILELRIFGGLTQEETAEVMGISRSTVTRQYQLAKAWLHNYFIED